MAGLRSPGSSKTKPFGYSNFQGLDTSRDVTALDTGEGQHLSRLVNGSCDWRGQIVRDPGAEHRHGNLRVDHIRFFGRNEAVYAEVDGAGINLVSERDHRLVGAYPRNTPISSTVFGRRAIFFAAGRPAHSYDGALFRQLSSPALAGLKPGFGTAVQRRLAVAGIIGADTQIHVSRVDTEDVFPADELADEVNVLRAGHIDIANLLGSADAITGLGVFETNRMAVFTNDAALLYQVDPNIDNWAIEANSSINIGCVSHNTIASAGRDLLYCSRSGVHSIRRSETNGITASSFSLTEKVDELYRRLLGTMTDPRMVSAVWDQDNAQYHVYFPAPSGVICTRLTMSLNPEGGEAQPKFSTAEFLNARCGACLGGKFLQGTPGGVYRMVGLQEVGRDPVTPDLEVVTPLLWHGSYTDEKNTHSLVLQASGRGVLELDAIDMEGRQIGSLRFEVDEDETDFHSVPLAREYERLWQHRYRAAQYRLRVRGGDGTLRIIGLAIKIKGD